MNVELNLHRIEQKLSEVKRILEEIKEGYEKLEVKENAEKRNNETT